MMSWIWLGMITLSAVYAAVTGRGDVLSAAVMQGAQSGIQLALSISGSICLWSGVGKLMDGCGITGLLAKILRPILHRVFPTSREDPVLRGALSANICANLLGLGNAATPLGIQAARRMKDPLRPERATDDLCRLVVLNTASIQLIPSNVAALRAGLGCAAPFDILPAVWVTSFCSAGAGLMGAWILGKLWKHG